MRGRIAGGPIAVLVTLHPLKQNALGVVFAQQRRRISLRSGMIGASCSMGSRIIAGSRLSNPSRYCSVGSSPYNPAANSQNRPRT